MIAVDTETSSLNPLEAKLIGISLCYKEGISYYVSMAHNSGKNVSLEKSLKKLKIILEDKSIKKIGQNIKYDIMVLKKYGIQINPFEDTMLLSYTLDAGLNRHNLDLLSEIHLGHKTIQYKDLVGSGKKKLNFNEVDTNKATEYAAEDADVTFRLYKYFKTRLDEDKLNGIYENFEKPMVSVLSKMEENGIKVDKDYLVDLSKKFQNRISKIEKQIFIISKKEFNIGSPKQLGEIIYNDLKIAKLKKTKKGGLATSANVLEDLAFSGHEFPKLVLEWRQLSKLKNTYTDALQEHINNKTGRVHTSFLLAATNTARLASSDPNLQNIPIKSTDGREIRKAFISEKNILISADYNQIEMRILADLADVKELKKAFKNNDDIHSITASQVFNLDIKKFLKNTEGKPKLLILGLYMALLNMV